MAQQRHLSHDEKKASEAAFRGLPFNPKWSSSAKNVYEGILHALKDSNREMPDPAPLSVMENFHAEEPEEEPGNLVPHEVPVSRIGEPILHADEDENIEEEESDSSVTFTIPTDSLPLNSRKQSITAGVVKDATPAAKRIGLEIPVGLTNVLWKNYVAISQDMTEETIQSRLQDIMVGVRLRLANLKEAIPFVDVPLLLHFPPENTPQVNLAFALFHRDPEEGPCLLLIHPGEILPPRQNISQN